jgi:hypothetical protein
MHIALNFLRLHLCSASNMPTYPNISTTIGTIWRFLPMADPLVNVVIVRDLDSRYARVLCTCSVQYKFALWIYSVILIKVRTFHQCCRASSFFYAAPTGAGGRLCRRPSYEACQHKGSFIVLRLSRGYSYTQWTLRKPRENPWGSGIIALG